jgi:hypothetical protein
MKFRGILGTQINFPILTVGRMVLSQPTWLRPCLEEACRIMVVMVSATSQCREKTKESILAEELRKCHHTVCHFIHLSTTFHTLSF